MSLAPTVRPSALVDYNTASWEQLQAWFCEHNNKITNLNELCTGVAYCHLMADLYPALLDRRQIRLYPGGYTERAINWRRLESALNDVVTKKINILERIKHYGHGNLDFCRWFVSFYEVNKDPGYLAKRLENRYAKGPLPRVGELIPKFLDANGISKRGKSYDESDDFEIKVTKEEKKLMKQLKADFNKGKTITGKEIFEMLGAKENRKITNEMIAEWKAEQSKKEEKSKKYKKGEETPSMWDYSERCLPKEFADLDPTQFLVDGIQKNLCFLPTDVLVKICEKLPPSDFLNLSSTCRYLHWRMFTFGKCYIPKTAAVSIYHVSIKNGKKYKGKLKDLYIDDKLKGIFVTEVSVLKRPFIFETLELLLMFDFYSKSEYDRCLPFILPLRQRCTHLMILFCTWKAAKTYNWDQSKCFNYPDSNDFFNIVKPYGYRVATGRWFYEEDTSDIFFKCSYARQMNNVRVKFDLMDSVACQLYAPIVLENKYGWYKTPTYESLISGIHEFINGTANLDFHTYDYDFSDNDDEEEESIEALSLKIRMFLFTHFLNLEEFYTSEYRFIYLGKFIGSGTGNKLRLKLIQAEHYPDLCVLIGKEEIFDEMEDKSQAFLGNMTESVIGERVWKMETAVEWEEIEEETTGREGGGLEETGEDTTGEEGQRWEKVEEEITGGGEGGLQEAEEETTGGGDTHAH